MKIEELKFDNSDIELFNNCFSEKRSGQVGWRVKVNGKFVKFFSNKSIWNKKSHAYCALVNHLGNYPIRRSIIKKYFRNDYIPMTKNFSEKDFWRLFISFLEENDVVEFVELK